jgi:hypothetical protein
MEFTNWCAHCKHWINVAGMPNSYAELKHMVREIEKMADETNGDEEMLGRAISLYVVSNYGLCLKSDFKYPNDRWPFTHSEGSCDEMEERPADDLIYLARHVRFWEA